jgi:hypothetical protein
MSFRRFFTFGLVLTLSVAMIGCAAQQPQGQQQAQDQSGGGFEGADINAPEWFLQPPQKDGSMMVASSGKSSRMNVALDKASLSAKRELAGNIRSTLEGQRDRYIEEIGNSANSDETVTREQYQDFTREMVAEELQGIRTVEKAVTREGGGYRAFVLVELTMDNIRDKLSGKEELKTRFNAKQFEEDMDKNLDELRKQRQQEMQ